MFKANEEGASIIRDTIKEYCDTFHQKVNLQKSSIFFGKGCAESIRNIVKTIFTVPNETLTEGYLGLHVGRSKNDSLKYLKDRLWLKVR